MFLLQNCAGRIHNCKLLHDPFFSVSMSGGLPFELQARKALADIVLGAIKDVKERLAQNNEES